MCIHYQTDKLSNLGGNCSKSFQGNSTYKVDLIESKCIVFIYCMQKTIAMNVKCGRGVGASP